MTLLHSCFTILIIVKGHVGGFGNGHAIAVIRIKGRLNKGSWHYTTASYWAASWTMSTWFILQKKLLENISSGDNLIIHNVRLVINPRSVNLNITSTYFGSSVFICTKACVRSIAADGRSKGFLRKHCSRKSCPSGDKVFGMSGDLFSTLNVAWT
jgi:hypothetical protein